MAEATHTHGIVELKRARWSSGLNVVAGLWLMSSPFLLGTYGIDNKLWNHLLVGVPVTGLAVIRAARPDYRPELSGLNAVFGVWMIASPFVLGYSANVLARNNSLATGIAVLILAAFSLYETHKAPIEPDRGPLDVS